MKRHSPSYAIRKLQIRTAMRYHYALIRMAKIQNTDNTKYRQGCEATKILLLLVGMQNGTATLEGSLAFSYKIKHILTIQSSNHAPWYLLKLTEKKSTEKPAYRCL